MKRALPLLFVGLLLLHCSSSSSGSGTAGACSQDSDCPAGQGCDTEGGATDGYCTPLCSDDTTCPTGFACPSGEKNQPGECDEQGDHANGQGICDQYDGQFGPKTCTGGGTGGTSGTGGTGGGTGGSQNDSGCSPLPASLGSYNLVLSVALDPSKPLVYRAEASSLEGGQVLSLSATPLDASDRTTPVGPAITLNSDNLGSGTLHFGPQEVTVPGAANPITGSDLVVTVELTGTICGAASFFCGEMSGQVTSPIPLDLAGSTFTLEATSEPELHIDCAKTVAGPPPA